MTNGPALSARDPRYQLCRGDSFDVTFPFTPEYNQTVTVQPDGFVALSGAGEISVVGKTLPEVQQLLQASYATTLHNAVINILLKDFEKPYFIAAGEVAHPGKYEFRRDTTLTEAVAVAGGFTQQSKHSQVLVFRRVPTGWVEIKKIDVKKMFKSGNLAEDIRLQAGDMFFVPQNRISKYGKYIPNPGIGLTATPAY